MVKLVEMAAGLAVDYIEFLNEKFMSEFKEAKEEFGVELPLLLHFEEIEKVLQEKSISPSTPFVMRKWLYTLKFALADCIMLAEKERKRKAQNKKCRLDSLPVKKLWFFCRTGRKLVKIKRKLQSMKDVDVAEDGGSLALSLTGSVKVCKNLWEGRGIFEFQIYGFDEQLKKIKSFLLQQPNFSNHINTVGIVGMRGVGKTCLAYLFVNNEAWKVFSPIIWVTLSEKKTDPSEIVRRLLKTLRDDDDDDIQAVSDDDDLAVQHRELHDRLSGKKYLIILDSVWHVSEWYSDLGSESSDHQMCFRNLSDSLPKECGGAVIVTGSEDVAISMVGEKNLVRLEPTFDAEAIWSIFMDSVRRKTFLTSDHHQRLSRMKDEIIDRCDRLPFAAKSLAEIISLQLSDKEHWSDPTERKIFVLRFNQLYDDDITKLFERLPGVDQVIHRSDCDEITVIGMCDPIAIARELEKSWQVELTSMKLASRSNFTKLTATQAIKALKFINKTKCHAGWAVVEKQFNELTASTDGLLHCSLFCTCIGMNMDSFEFASALFDALATRQNIDGDSINKAKLKEFWDQISYQSYQSTLQTFFDVVDKGANGRITEEEVKELISLCTSAEKVTNIQKVAEEYAASIMKELDPEKNGCIMMKNLEQRRLLHWSDSYVLKIFVLRFNQPYDDDITKLVERLPGVDQVIHRSDCDEITVVGTCDPIAIVRELEKFWQVELTSVKLVSRSKGAQALKGLKFITNTKCHAGWAVVEKQFNELTASTDGLLHRSLFCKCIGMRESKDFAGELFDALARRRNIEGDSINKAQLKDFWDQISDQTMDSRLQLFFAMVDKDADGRITIAEVKEIIRLSASTNKLKKIQEQVDEYADLIMEALDPENHKCIMIEDLERLLLQAPNDSPRGGESLSLSQIMTQTLRPAQEKNPLIRWYQDVKYFLQDNWQRAWVITLWIGVMLGLFAYKFMQYRNRADAYEVMGHCVCMAKGAAETLKLNMALMLLPVCRNTITWLRNKTKLGVAVPFYDNINFHQIIAVAIAIGVGIHGIYHLACDFPRVLNLDNEKYAELMKQYFGGVQPSSYWFFVKGVEGVTGIVIVVLMAIAFALASPWLRRGKLNLPKHLKKVLFVIVYTLLIVHGIKLYLIHEWYKKTTWMYLAVPITLYAGERLIRAFRSTIKPVKILKVAVYPGNVLAIHMSKPQGFKYKSGQYVFANCAAVSPFEWHPFYITSAPGNDYLSVHIRTLGDWTRQLKNVFSQVRQAPPNGKSGLLRGDRLQGDNSPDFPRVLIDGPYGEPTQDYKKYDVVLLVGLGIEATPLISIVQDIVNNMKAMEEEENALENGVAGGGYNTPPISGSNFKTRRAYFYWVTREQGSFDWFKGVMNEVAEMDHRGVIEMHNYYTSVYEEGDARSALIAMVQSLNHAKNGTDVVSGTRVRSHFAKPNWQNVYKRIALNHTDARIGVFYCGPPALTKELRKLASDFSHTTSTKFEFHKENF